MFQRVRCGWLKWRRKTKRLHRLTFGLLLGLIEAASGYAWLALGLHEVCIGINGVV